MPRRTSNLAARYYKFLTKMVGGTRHNDKDYIYLFDKLHHVDYYWILLGDENRAADGIELRSMFGTYAHVNDEDLEAIQGPCSVLEMLVAFASRIERDIMSDRAHPDRTSVWFWDMLSNLGLDEFDDNSFDVVVVDNILMRFLDREYGSDGRGSLFKLDQNARVNYQIMELWVQMMHSLET